MRIGISIVLLLFSFFDNGEEIDIVKMISDVTYLIAEKLKIVIRHPIGMCGMADFGVKMKRFLETNKSINKF